MLKTISRYHFLTGPDGEPIDHDSLAEYFARGNAPSSVDSYQPYGLAAIEGPTPPSTIEQHLYSMTKSIRLVYCTETEH